MCSRQHIIKTFPAFKECVGCHGAVSRGDFIASLCSIGAILLTNWTPIYALPPERLCMESTHRSLYSGFRKRAQLAKTYARARMGFLISKAFGILSVGHFFSVAVIQQCALAARDSLSCGE